MTEQQIEYINNRSEIAGHLEAIVSEIYLIEESGKIESWFVTIPDMNSFVAETNMDREQILFLLDSAHKYHI
ncbi:cell division protein FtsK, partial [Streptococcus agalactiae]